MDDMAVNDLPNDVAALKDLLRQAQARLSEQNREIQSLHRLIHAYQEEKRLAAARAFAPSTRY